MLRETRFEEGQSFAPVVYVMIAAGIGAMMLPPRHWALISLPLVAMVCAANLLYMKTKVSGRVIHVRFGSVLPFYVRTIDIAEVEGVEPVTYSPVAEYGGWGIRGVGSKVALNARGNLGVLLRLAGGKTVLVGSQRPEELAEAIRSANH